MVLLVCSLLRVAILNIKNTPISMTNYLSKTTYKDGGDNLGKLNESRTFSPSINTIGT